MKLSRSFLFLIAIVNAFAIKAQLTIDGVVKHAAPTSTTSVGNITLNVSGGTSPYTYSWSPGSNTTAVLSNAARNNYTVTVNDAGTLTATYLYSLGYKTNWMDCYGGVFKNDSLLAGYNISKNTLPANTDGWAEFAVPSTSASYFVGFSDSLSVYPSFYDTDFGVYVYAGNLYYVSGNYYTYITPALQRDVIRLERADTLFNLKINGVTVGSEKMPKANKFKLHAIIYNEALANIGASFPDSTNTYFANYVRDHYLLKHCTPGSNNGSISLTPKINTNTYLWSPGSATTSAISGLSPGSYAVKAKDQNFNQSYHKYNVGYKTTWRDIYGSVVRNDSLLAGYSISKNTLLANTDGWTEFVMPPLSASYFVGFTDSLSSYKNFDDTDFGIYVVGSYIYYISGTYYSLVATAIPGAVIRLERADTLFNLKIDGLVIGSEKMSKTKNFKLQTLIYSGALADVGASFTDSTNINFPHYLKDYAVIRHESPGLDNASISLTSKIIGEVHTYTFSPGSSTVNPATSLSAGVCTVTTKDTYSNTNSQYFNVGYKTHFNNTTGMIQRNDSLIPNGYPEGVSKNTLLSGQDGWAEIILTGAPNYYSFGFLDSATTLTGYSDIDYGFYKHDNAYIYGIDNSVLTSLLVLYPQKGDVYRVERKDTMFYFKINGVVYYSVPMPKYKNYKLKVSFRNNDTVCNIGASFADSTNITFHNFVRNKPLIKHSSGMYINDGSIELSSKYNEPGHNSNWTAGGEITPGIYNRTKGVYNVTVQDTLGNTSNYNYDILYKAKWDYLDYCITRNDSLMNNTGYMGYFSAATKNILKANNDGEVNWVVNNIASYMMFGFVDTLSSTSGDIYNVDQGISTALENIYYWNNGYYLYLSPMALGDIVKIKRQSDTVRIYLNDAVIFTTTVTNANVDWRVKAILYPGNSICNIGCSFSTDLSATVIKEHADYDNLHNGFAYIIPDNGTPSYKVSWVDGMISDTRNDLSVGNHLATITDSTETKFGKDFAIGVKPVWNINQGLNYMRDSLELFGGVTPGALISHNTSFNNEAAWFEFRVNDKNTDLAFGFIGNPKTAMDTSFVPAVFTATLMEQRLNHAKQLYAKATNTTLTYAGGRLVIDSSATNLFYVRLYNGNLLSLVNTATTTQYPINNGDVIRVGRNEDGNFYLAVNGNVLVKYSNNINDQYLVSSFLTNASKVKVSQVGIYTKVPLEIYPEHVIVKDPKCLNDVCRNWSSSRVYNENGGVVSQSKQYYDNLGRPTQAQQKIISENNILANEVIYDSYGRPTGQTLPAPMFTSAFCYNNLFFTNASNQHYGVDDFDKPNTTNKYYGERYNPALVGNSNQGTLGWYYSNNNTNNLYVPADSFPYNRVEYYNDPLHRVYKSSNVGRFHKLGSGHEIQTFYLNSTNELQAIYQKIVPNQIVNSYELNDAFESLTYNSGGTYFNNNIYNVHKTVEINEDGHDYVTYTNSMGQVLATCTSGYDASCGSYPVTNNVVKDVFSLIHLPKQENNSLSFACTPVALTNIVPVIRLYTTKQVLVLGTDFSFNTTTGAVTFLGDYATSDLFIELSYDLSLTFTAVPSGVTETHKTGYTNWTVYYYDVKGRLKAYISPNDFKCPEIFSASIITNSNVPLAFSCDPSSPLAFLSVPADTTGNNTAPDVSIQFKPMFTSFDTLRTVFSATDFYLQTNDTLAPVDTLMALQFFKTSFQDSLVTDTIITAKMFLHDSLYQIERQLLLDSAFKLLDGKEVVYKSNYIIGKMVSGSVTYFDSLPLPFNYTVKFSGRQAVFENNLSEEFLTARIDSRDLAGASALVIKCDSFKIQAKGFYNSPVNYFNPCNQSMYVGQEDAQILATLNSNISLNLISAFIISPQPTTPPAPADFFTKKFYYNKYDHLVATETKDEGRTDYFYDLKEDKLFYTQNDKQRANGGKFNYMKYDDLGRAIESGEYDPAVSDPSVMFNFEFQTYDDYDNAVATNPGYTSVGGYAAANDNIPATLRCTQATNIEYAKADASNPLISTYPQNYLNGKISKTFNDKQTTWYSYDEEGNLEYSVQDMAGFAVKTMDYNYDFFGNLNHTTYQLGQSDEFKHLYTYDADLNLKKTQFTRPGFSLPEDAALYSYYLHGPLKRQVLGNNLQGLDYVYTLRGALKSVNNPFNASTITGDPGGDGNLSTAATFDDFFAYALDYYPNDYERGTTTPMAAKNLGSGYSQLNISYTGQVSAFRWNRAGTTPNTGISSGPYIYEFNYDELYRLIAANYGTYGVNTSNPPTFIPTASNSFKLENVSYDKIGNIKTLKRYALAATGNVPVLMDDLTYNYNTTIKNRLKNVGDAITGSLGYNAETDLPHQSSATNYAYDAIGQVTLNVQDNQRYEYNASGLVTKIINNTTSNFITEFEYNDKGLRSAKTTYNSGGTAISKRFYVYDASGVQVASYERTSFPSGTAALQDLTIYSGGRIGLYDIATGKPQYELTDHLGNVRTVFTTGSTYATSILQTSDYYPHGSPLAGANYYSTTAYRYAHQGQERDAETGLTSFELRQMDPRLGRWISPDPYAQHHSPYLSMSNNPVNNIDPDGGMDYAGMQDPNVGQYGKSDSYMQGQGYSQVQIDAARLQMYGNFSQHQNFKPADCSFSPTEGELKSIAFTNYLLARQVEKAERKKELSRLKSKIGTNSSDKVYEIYLGTKRTKVFEYSYISSQTTFTRTPLHQIQPEDVHRGYGPIEYGIEKGLKNFGKMLTSLSTYKTAINNIGDALTDPDFQDNDKWYDAYNNTENFVKNATLEDWSYGITYATLSYATTRVMGAGLGKLASGEGLVLGNRNLEFLYRNPSQRIGGTIFSYKSPFSGKKFRLDYHGNLFPKLHMHTNYFGIGLGTHMGVMPWNFGDVIKIY